jgi:RNA polymerase sigma-70 factor (ECF subfamily)
MSPHPADGDETYHLLEELRSSDDVEAAFRALFRRYHQRLLGFFLRRGFNPETADELSQETFLRVFRSRRDFRGEVPLPSWIFQIAANVYRNELRRRLAGKRSGEELSLDDDDQATPGPAEAEASPGPTTAAEPLSHALWREQVAALRSALARLPPQGRRAMQMRVGHGYSVAQIAVVMKLTESTVKVHLHQARKRLRELLRGHFGELPF